MGQFSYLCGFTVSILQSGTAGASGAVTAAGLSVGNVFTYQTGSQAINAAFNLTQTFTPCLAGGSLGSAISVSTTANLNAAAVDVNVWGYRE
jgi:hypothetical protein